MCLCVCRRESLVHKEKVWQYVFILIVISEDERERERESEKSSYKVIFFSGSKLRGALKLLYGRKCIRQDNYCVRFISKIMRKEGTSGFHPLFFLLLLSDGK